jgi:hypothetical protein
MRAIGRTSLGIIFFITVDSLTALGDPQRDPAVLPGSGGHFPSAQSIVTPYSRHTVLKTEASQIQKAPGVSESTLHTLLGYDPDHGSLIHGIAYSRSQDGHSEMEETGLSLHPVIRLQDGKKQTYLNLVFNELLTTENPRVLMDKSNYAMRDVVNSITGRTQEKKFGTENWSPLQVKAISHVRGSELQGILPLGMIREDGTYRGEVDLQRRPPDSEFSAGAVPSKITWEVRVSGGDIVSAKINSIPLDGTRENAIGSLHLSGKQPLDPPFTSNALDSLARR